MQFWVKLSIRHCSKTGPDRPDRPVKYRTAGYWTGGREHFHRIVANIAPMVMQFVSNTDTNTNFSVCDADIIHIHHRYLLVLLSPKADTHERREAELTYAEQ